MYEEERQSDLNLIRQCEVEITDRIGQITDTQMLVIVNTKQVVYADTQVYPGSECCSSANVDDEITICSVLIGKNAGYPVLRHGHPSFQIAPPFVTHGLKAGPTGEGRGQIRRFIKLKAWRFMGGGREPALLVKKFSPTINHNLSLGTHVYT